MKNALEKDVEAFLVRQVRARGWVTWKLAPTEVGIPDRIVLVPGGSVWFIELKRARGGRVSERQKYLLRVLERGGHAGCVLAGVEEVKKWLDERDKERASEIDRD
jgi:VRR_NUC domain-containing protein